MISLRSSILNIAEYAFYLKRKESHCIPFILIKQVQQKRRQQQQLQNRPPPQQRQYASNPRPVNGGLKNRISQALTLSRQDKNKYVYQAQPLTKIHAFSFMDSKMGTYADEREIQDYMTRDMETRSDIGGVKKRNSSDSSLPPWHNDTLSVSTLRRAKKLLDQQHQLSTSVPNLSNHKDKSMNGSTPELRHKGESYSDFGADIKQKKKVNRFKFWKLFGKKKSKKDSVTDSASSLGFDEPKANQIQDERVMDVRL